MEVRGAAGEEARRARRALRGAASAIGTALRFIEGENVRLRAMALTYISLFAMVPALVVAFSVVQAFTGMERISARVNDFLFENLAVGARATLEPYLARFVQNAHVTSIGLVGAALLVWSAVTLVWNVDGAVNHIWGIRRRRSLKEQAVISWLVLTFGPLLLAASVMAGHKAQQLLARGGAAFLASAASVALTCTFFAMVYLVLPNTRVRLRAAALGGLVAGAVWEVAKWGYTIAVARIFRYQAIYGSLAAIPIFLLWLYVSWAILLFGARLSYLVQYASVLIQGTPHPGSKTGREILAGRVMLAIARAFDGGAPAPDGGELATGLALDAEDVGEAVAALRQRGLVVVVAEGGLVPSRPLERITLEDVRSAVSGEEGADARVGGLVGEIVSGAEDAAAERLAAVTFRDLCERDRSGRAHAPPAPLPAAPPDGPGDGARKASGR